MADAAQARLDVVALSDHDTLHGLDEARLGASENGLTLVPALELSAQVIDNYPGAKPRSVHLLGYCVDPRHLELVAEMERIRAHRDDRLRLMVEKLGEDFDISWDEVSAGISPGATPGRPHIAQVMINRGFLVDTDEAFAGPLRADGPYHVPHYAPRLHRAIEIIADSGGVPVLAHPYTGARSGAVDHTQAVDKILGDYEKLVDLGLKGLEIDHRENTEPGKALLRRVAKEFDLIVTGSSDYHGDKKQNQLGENLTTEANYQRILELGVGSAPSS
jgi:predicted metal-dependent phosphoesterase TrpH